MVNTQPGPEAKREIEIEPNLPSLRAVEATLQSLSDSSQPSPPDFRAALPPARVHDGFVEFDQIVVDFRGASR
jgi:hypothetical protein